MFGAGNRHMNFPLLDFFCLHIILFYEGVGRPRSSQSGSVLVESKHETILQLDALTKQKGEKMHKHFAVV